jgi:hypothetical protein
MRCRGIKRLIKTAWALRTKRSACFRNAEEAEKLYQCLNYHAARGLSIKKLGKAAGIFGVE